MTHLDARRRPVAVFGYVHRRHRPSAWRTRGFVECTRRRPSLAPNSIFPLIPTTTFHFNTTPSRLSAFKHHLTNLHPPAKMLPTLVFAMLAVKAIYSRKWAKTALKVATLAAFTLGLVLTLAPTTTSALPTPVLQLSGHEHGHHEPPPPGSHATLAPATMTLPTPILQPSDVAHDPNQPPVSHGTSMTFEQLVSRQVRQSHTKVIPRPT